jgi:hypothetical protein
MSYPLAPTALRSVGIVFGTILVAIVALSTAALAIDGRTAVGVCIDSTASGARCAWAVNDKGEIDICNKNGCVYCPSATSECTVAKKGRPRPTRALPVGVKIETPILSVRTTKQPFTGSILRFRCPQGTKPCPGSGCIPRADQCNPVM